jgi:hypothetical protein
VVLIHGSSRARGADIPAVPYFEELLSYNQPDRGISAVYWPITMWLALWLRHATGVAHHL